MKLILNDIKTVVAESKIKDDAFELWISCNYENKGNAAPAAFYSRLHIQEGFEYLLLTFVDIETGELLHLNAMPKMHKAMVSLNLYPDVILNAFKNK